MKLGLLRWRFRFHHWLFLLARTNFVLPPLSCWLLWMMLLLNESCCSIVNGCIVCLRLVIPCVSRRRTAIASGIVSGRLAVGRTLCAGVGIVRIHNSRRRGRERLCVSFRNDWSSAHRCRIHVSSRGWICRFCRC